MLSIYQYFILHEIGHLFCLFIIRTIKLLLFFFEKNIYHLDHTLVTHWFFFKNVMLSRYILSTYSKLIDYDINWNQ